MSGQYTKAEFLREEIFQRKAGKTNRKIGEGYGLIKYQNKQRIRWRGYAVFYFNDGKKVTEKGAIYQECEHGQKKCGAALQTEEQTMSRRGKVTVMPPKQKLDFQDGFKNY